MTRPESTRIGLALAGGGPLGAIYEIGALCALEEAFAGADFTRLDGYVGVSAGGFIAAGLANGISPRQLCTSFILNDGPAEDIIRPGLFARPAWREYARRLAMLPALVAHAAWDYAFERRSLLTALERLGRALPSGLFCHDALERQLAAMLSAPGRSNDFRHVARPLVIVATDLDSGQSAPFGRPGFEHVPISRAVAASAALPGLFPPVAIDGRCYVDGALKKTLHARVLLDLDMDLVLCLNPLVPFESGHLGRHATPTARAGQRIPRLADGGLPVVLSQTFRTLIHSRLELGMRGYEATHPDTEIVLFEPDQRDPEMFLANTFGYSQRRAMAEHAYQQTRADLRARRAELAPRLARHGIVFDDAALDDETRRLIPPRRRPRPAHTPTARAMRRLDQVLDELEQRLARAA
ncbi:patatin [Rubrivivax gelatinosus]|nr:patatin [Rubrivivax gelatinosus]